MRIDTNKLPSTPIAPQANRPATTTTPGSDCTPVAQQCKSTLENYNHPAAPAAQRLKKRNLAVKAQGPPAHASAEIQCDCSQQVHRLQITDKGC